MQKERFKFQKMYKTNSAEKFKISEVQFNSTPLLMKRFNMILKAKKAQTFGIVVMNSFKLNFRQELDNLKALLRAKEKKFYVFTMNKLNEAKLKNFPEIDVYVVISCPKSCLYDYKEFYKTILLPYELQLCFEQLEWTGAIQLETQFDEEFLDFGDEGKGLEEKLERQVALM
jgi:diphthamide biosynthesis protein 2